MAGVGGRAMTTFERPKPPRRGVIEHLDVGPISYLMIDGHGDPNTSAAYRRALAALYPFAYAVRGISKSELGQVYPVSVLEGLWSAPDLDVFLTRDKDAWDWTMMLAQPSWITHDIAAEARQAVERKGVDGCDEVRFEPLTEGPCVQLLHVGSFDDEGPVLAHLHDEYIPSQGLRMRGLHHEIYLTDARKTPPARQRTILRQPVEPL